MIEKLRVTCFHDQACEIQQAEWSLLRGLQDGGATASDCWCELVDGEVDRVVPGNNGTDHSHGFVAGPADGITVDGDQLPVAFIGPSSAVARRLGGGCHVSPRIR